LNDGKRSCFNIARQNHGNRGLVFFIGNLQRNFPVLRLGEQFSRIGLADLDTAFVYLANAELQTGKPNELPNRPCPEKQ
jgi:hypothetical protein